MATSRQKKRRNAIRRSARMGISMAGAVLKAATSLVVPDEQSQRKAFSTLMPQIYALRTKGCSWPQLAKLLNGCGFDLRPETVRAYYTDKVIAAGN